MKFIVLKGIIRGVAYNCPRDRTLVTKKKKKNRVYQKRKMEFIHCVNSSVKCIIRIVKKKLPIPLKISTS